ncbi:PDDEXK nuclease domain-containing protein [Desulfoplanes sp.]
MFASLYVNYFDRHVKLDDEKPTIGILLCLTKSDELVELTLPKEANIYASEYQLYLPDKEALKQQMEEVHKEWEIYHPEHRM